MHVNRVDFPKSPDPDGALDGELILAEEMMQGIKNLRWNGYIASQDRLSPTILGEKCNSIYWCTLSANHTCPMIVRGSYGSSKYFISSRVS